MTIALSVQVERFPIDGTFTISRGSRTEAVVVVVHLGDGLHTGRGECVPYPRYGESVESVVASVEAMAAKLARRPANRQDLAGLMPAGAARNAIDSAMWDLEAKRTGTSVAAMCGIATMRPVITCYTISLGTPESMEAAARTASHRPLLKVKLGGEGDVARIAAIRRGAPQSRIVVDANESWTPLNLEENLAACLAAGVELIEQPLPSGKDQMLARISRPIPVCADESLHVAEDLASLADRYDAINIKLDKAGGLTEALRLHRAARATGLKIMVGCMVGTSLAMAPAAILAQDADVVDLDGPLLLARDRVPAIRYEGSLMYPPPPELWG